MRHLAVQDLEIRSGVRLGMKPQLQVGAKRNKTTTNGEQRRNGGY